MKLGRLGQGQNKAPKVTPGNKFGVWKNRKDEWCVGNECFSMKATTEGIQVKMNPDAGKKCPDDMHDAAEALMDLVKEKKPTTFTVPPKGYHDW